MVKILSLAISIFILMSCTTSNIKQDNSNTTPFSFDELLSTEEVTIPPLQFIKANDNTKLAYREYVPEEISAVLIFYHGGGAYCTGGYELIGNGLSNSYNVLVVTPDIRGHGDSGGERGDASSIEQIFDDVAAFIGYIKMKCPDIPLFLGGHSSGAGLVLNYSDTNNTEINGYVFLSPQLGFRSETELKNNPNPFAEVNTSLFVDNARFGTHGNSQAVFFNYPEEILKKDSKLLTAITVNMANAITPSSPAKQIHNIDLPMAVWIGMDDELLDAMKVTAFVKKNNSEAYIEIVENEKHLSIILAAANPIGTWIQNIIQKK